MSNLSERLADLSPEQREKLLRKLKAQKAKSKKQTGQSIVVQKNEANEYPLSPAQQRLWLAEQLMPGLPVYNMPHFFRIEGALNRLALKQAVLAITERHASLRTRFISRDGEGFQIIDPTWQGEFFVKDLTELSAADRETKVAELLDAEAKRPFALTDNTFFRAGLLKLSADDAVLMLNMHHIIADGWSIGILTQELSVLYKAFAQKEDASLDTLPVQYKDFAVHQIEHVDDPALQKQTAYWKEQLAGELPVLEIPLSEKRSTFQQNEGDIVRFNLDADILVQLKELSQKEGASLYMTCLAAYQVLLARYSGQEEVIVGTAVANRNRVEVENLIGFFVNMVPIRTDLSGNPLFRELVRRVRPLALDAFGNQEVSFDRMIELVESQIEPGNSPIFQTDFTLQSGPVQLQLDGLNTTYLHYHSGTTKFDLSLELWEEDGALSGIFEFSTGLFRQETIEQMVSHFKVLLQGIIANPDTPIQHLPLLTKIELENIKRWNGDVIANYQPETFNNRFEANVAACPEAIAIQFENETITYQQLNTRANQIARQLQEFGAQPNQLVGICMPRSIALFVGIIGILKSGAGYVPIDPEYPVDRKAFMLEDANAVAVLTHSAVADQLPATQAERILLDMEWDTLDSYDASNLQTAVSPQDPAYVIYTSGSTGKPKGVIIAHQSLVSYAENASKVYEMDATSRVLQFSSISFDISVEEIFCTFVAGGTLVLRTDAMLDAIEFAQRCDEWGITTLSLPTAFWHEFVLALKQSATMPRALKMVLIGGEKVQAERVADWLAIAGESPRLLNTYGPTEGTVVATYADMSPLQVVAGEPLDVHIGRPFSNVQTYVLSKYLQPVPVGIPGELHIGGIQVAQGYKNRPELTAKVFIDNPFTQGEKDRLYKTGDSVRYRPDGNIDFIGRVDYQVKIRGFRVEPSGIELVLNQHTAVQESIVLAWGGGPAGKRLVAYVVLDEGQALTNADLQEYLQDKLPEYMVPSAFVILDEFPLTQNGKINRRALPEPSEEQFRSHTTEFVAPESETEQKLANIWSKTLDVSQIGVDDNLFELGGNSLLIARMIAQIKEVTGEKLPLATFFEYPTIRQLAQVIDGSGDDAQVELKRPNDYKPWVIPIQPNGSKRPFFHMGGSALLYNLARYLGDDQPLFGILEQDIDGDHPLYVTVEDIVPHCIEGIKSVQPEGPYILGGLCFGAVVSVEVARALQAQGDEVDLVVMIDSYAPGAVHPIANDSVDLGANPADETRGIYIFEQSSADIVQKIKDKAWRKSWKHIHNFYTKIGQPMPYRFRDIEEANTIANDQYTANEYNGRTILFQVEIRDPRMQYSTDLMGWGPFLKGETALYEVPGGHLSVYDEPYVKTLGLQIGKSIDELREK